MKNMGTIVSSDDQPDVFGQDPALQLLGRLQHRLRDRDDIRSLLFGNRHGHGGRRQLTPVSFALDGRVYDMCRSQLGTRAARGEWEIASRTPTVPDIALHFVGPVANGGHVFKKNRTAVEYTDH
jgi:hypothetical protein